jgi:hypothetical protein
MGAIHRALKARLADMEKADPALAAIRGNASLRAKAAQALYAEMNARNNARLQDLERIVTKVERKLTKKGAR